MISRLRSFIAPLGVVLLAAGCTGNGSPTTSDSGSAPASGIDPASLVVQVASSDLFVGDPQRVDVGIQAGSSEQGVLLATAGEIDVSFSPYEDGAGTRVEGSGRYVPAPGTEVAPDGPTLTPPAESRGVYEVADVTFDAAGIWVATATFSVDGEGPFEVASTPFNVLEEPAYPAPGEKALRTKNLTLESDAPAEAIDSGAVSTGEVPDPELHEWTIAGALEQGRPIVALFATPTYCVSLFCGPVTDAVRDLAAEYDDKAVFIHVEIWRDHDGNVLNEAAADWLYRNDNLTEPWLFLIDDRGTIVDRWGPLFDPDDVGDALAAMPDMPR